MSAEDALRFVECSDRMIPYVPELPLRGVDATMLYAPFESFDSAVRRELFPRAESDSVLVAEESVDHFISLCGDSGADDERIAGELFCQTLAHFGPETKHLVSGMVGPATLLGSLFRGDRAHRVPLALDEPAIDAVCTLIQRIITARIRLAERSGVQLLQHLDEPLLPYLPAAVRARLGFALGEVLKAVRADGIVGVHCCGKLAEDELSYFSSLELSLLSIPFRSEAGPGAELQSDVLERGGWLLAGVVRTDGSATGFEDSRAELRRLAQRGMESRVVVTPDCGLGLLGPEGARRVMDQLMSYVG